MTIINGVLARQWYDANGKLVHHQWVAPRAAVLEILQQAHDNPMSGHFADKRTLKRVREMFYWQGMDKDTRQYCRACAVCGERKPRPTVPHHPVQRQIATEPLQWVALDIKGPMPRTEKGNKYILVISDYFTKWICAVPMADQRAETCAAAFVSEFVCRYGIPGQLHSDQGRQFESALWSEMCRLLHITKTRTTAFHPQGDGQAERSIKSVTEILAKLAREQPKAWDTWLPYACAAYNSSVHRVTGETPHLLMFGREMRTPVTLLAPPLPGDESPEDWVAKMQKRFIDMHATVVERTQASHRADTPWTDRRQKGYVFKEKDLVRLWDPKPKRGSSRKMNARWSGPWEITKQISACVYAIRHVENGKRRVVNVDRLMPCEQLNADQFPRSDAARPNDDVTSDSDPDTTGHDADNTDANEWWPTGTRTESDDVTSAEQTDGAEAAEDSWPAVPMSFTATRRAQRARRAPAWQGTYDMDDSWPS